MTMLGITPRMVTILTTKFDLVQLEVTGVGRL